MQARCLQVLKDEEIDSVRVLIGMVWKHLVLSCCDFDPNSFAGVSCGVFDYYLCELRLV